MISFVRTHGTAAVILFCAAALPAYAQHDGHDGQDARQGGKQEQAGAARPQGNRGQQARKERQQPSRDAQQPHQHDRARQPRQQRTWQQQPQQASQQQQPRRSREQAQAWQSQQGWQHGGGWKGNDTWQGDRARDWSSDHRDWAQRGGYGGFYVPQASFSLYFGRGHFFRLGAQPFMDQGYPRFEYGGYSFLMLDPYPQNWPGNWYSSDDLYIDYNNGYYLYNRSYPGIGLAITLQM